MIGALVGRTLRQYGPILCGAVLFLFVFEVGLVFVATQFEGGEGIGGIVDMLPSLLRDLVLAKVKDFSAPALVGLGFHHPMTYMVMLGLSVLLGSAPAADRESGLIELIASRPVPRSSYLAAVWLSVVVLWVALPLAVFAGGLVGVHLFEVAAPDPVGELGRSALACAGLMAATTGLTLLCATASRRRFSAVVSVLAILLPSFVIDFLSFLWTGLDLVRWFSLFHYVPSLPGAEATVPFGTGLAVLASVALVSTVAAFWRWERQDL